MGESLEILNKKYIEEFTKEVMAVKNKVIVNVNAGIYGSYLLTKLQSFITRLKDVNYSLVEVDRFLSIFDDVLPNYVKPEIVYGVATGNMDTTRYYRYLETKTKLITDLNFFNSIRKVANVVNVTKENTPIEVRAYMASEIYYNIHETYTIGVPIYQASKSKTINLLIEYTDTDKRCASLGKDYTQNVRFLRDKEFIGDAQYIEARNGKFLVSLYNRERGWNGKLAEIQFTKTGYKLFEIENKEFEAIDFLWKPIRKERTHEFTDVLGVRHSLREQLI